MADKGQRIRCVNVDNFLPSGDEMAHICKHHVIHDLPSKPLILVCTYCNCTAH